MVGVANLEDINLLVLVMGQIVHIETTRTGLATVLSKQHMFPECNFRLAVHR